MKLPARPTRLIREFCEIRYIAYGWTRSSWEMSSTFHRLHGHRVLTYELMGESGVIRVSGDAVDAVVVPGHMPDHCDGADPFVVYCMGRLDDDHVVTLAETRAKDVMLCVWRVRGAGTDDRDWVRAARVRGLQLDGRWSIYSAHHKGISVMSRPPTSAWPQKVLEWDWRNDRVAYASTREKVEVGRRPAEMIRCGFHSDLCQIHNTRFLGGGEAVELESVTSFDLGGLRSEVFLSVPEMHTGRMTLRESMSEATCESIWFGPGTSHILDNCPLRPPVYIRMCERVGFAILDLADRRMRHFPLARMIREWDKKVSQGCWVRQVEVGAPHRIEVQHTAGQDFGPQFSWSIMPVEIDGGEDWIRLAIFGGSMHYAVQICLRSWKAALLGFFKILDGCSDGNTSSSYYAHNAFRLFPTGLIRYDDPRVSVLDELNF